MLELKLRKIFSFGNMKTIPQIACNKALKLQPKCKFLWPPHLTNQNPNPPQSSKQVPAYNGKIKIVSIFLHLSNLIEFFFKLLSTC